MTGQVLDYSVQTNEGIISGADGRRYTFRGADWPPGATPARGTPVDFEPRDGSRAEGIYLMEGATGATPPAGTAAQPGTAAAGKTRMTALLLALLLGGLGGHKFYLGEPGGVLRILLSCTIIGLPVSGFLGLLDAIKLAQLSDTDFDRRYNTGAAPAPAGRR